MRILFIVLLVSLLPYAAHADSLERAQFESALNEINRIKPLQNPRYEASEDILDRDIISRQNRVVGDIHDVLVNLEDGRISKLLIDFDRLHLKQPVFLEYDAMDISSRDNGYKLDFTEESLEAFYPELLASIEPAAGTEGDILSLQSMIGRDVLTSNNLKIGKIQEVLFNDNGVIAQYVYLNINYKTIHDEGVSVPLNSLRFQSHHDGRPVAIIDKVHGEAVIAFVKNK